MSNQQKRRAIPGVLLGVVWVMSFFVPVQTAPQGAGETITPPEILIHETPVGPVFADPHGYTLYVTERDSKPDESTCFGACIKEWPPVRAVADAKPFGDWTLVPRDDGEPQWAYQGRPLYRYRRESRTGWAEAQSRVWLIATTTPFPVRGTRLRYGQDPNRVPKTRVAVSAVPGGIIGWVTPLGEVLADWNGMTLYTLPETDTCVDRCLETWTPLAAPMAAVPSGHWALRPRPDGAMQWAYKGLALYRCVNDAIPGDAHCENVGGRTVRVPLEVLK